MSKLSRDQQRAVTLAVYRRSPNRAVDYRTVSIAVRLGRFDDSPEAQDVKSMSNRS